MFCWNSICIRGFESPIADLFSCTFWILFDTSEQRICFWAFIETALCYYLTYLGIFSNFWWILILLVACDDVYLGFKKSRWIPSPAPDRLLTKINLWCNTCWHHDGQHYSCTFLTHLPFLALRGRAIPRCVALRNTDITLKYLTFFRPL